MDLEQDDILMGAGLLALIALIAHSSKSSTYTPQNPTREVQTGIFQFSMRNGAFDTQPSCVVVIPPRFDASKPLDLALYVPGFNNCVDNLVRDADGTCRPGGSRHNSSHLATQFINAGVNAVLVLIGLRREEATGDPGRLRRAGALNAFLNELLGEHLAPMIGARSLSQVRNISLSCHSGGYTAVAAMIRAGDISTQLREVGLFDALYGDTSTYTQWATSHAMSPYRFVDVFTGGSTESNSRSIASAIQRGIPADMYWFNDNRATPSADILRRPGSLFSVSGLSHTEVSRVWPNLFWSTSLSFEKI